MQQSEMRFVLSSEERLVAGRAVLSGIAVAEKVILCIAAVAVELENHVAALAGDTLCTVVEAEHLGILTVGMRSRLVAVVAGLPGKRKIAHTEKDRGGHYCPPVSRNWSLNTCVVRSRQ